MIDQTGGVYPYVFSVVDSRSRRGSAITKQSSKRNKNNLGLSPLRRNCQRGLLFHSHESKLSISFSILTVSSPPSRACSEVCTGEFAHTKIEARQNGCPQFAFLLSQHENSLADTFSIYAICFVTDTGWARARSMESCGGGLLWKQCCD